MFANAPPIADAANIAERIMMIIMTAQKIPTINDKTARMIAEHANMTGTDAAEFNPTAPGNRGKKGRQELCQMQKIIYEWKRKKKMKKPKIGQILYYVTGGPLSIKVEVVFIGKKYFRCKENSSERTFYLKDWAEKFDIKKFPNRIGIGLYTKEELIGTNLI